MCSPELSAFCPLTLRSSAMTSKELQRNDLVLICCSLTNHRNSQICPTIDAYFTFFALILCIDLAEMGPCYCAHKTFIDICDLQKLRESKNLAEQSRQTPVKYTLYEIKTQKFPSSFRTPSNRSVSTNCFLFSRIHTHCPLFSS